MATNVIPFPQSHIYRSAELIEAIEKLRLSEEKLNDQRDCREGVVARCVGEIMVKFWEEELRNLGGVPIGLLARDGIDAK